MHHPKKGKITYRYSSNMRRVDPWPLDIPKGNTTDISSTIKNQGTRPGLNRRKNTAQERSNFKMLSTQPSIWHCNSPLIHRNTKWTHWIQGRWNRINWPIIPIHPKKDDNIPNRRWDTWLHPKTSRSNHEGASHKLNIQNSRWRCKRRSKSVSGKGKGLLEPVLPNLTRNRWPQNQNHNTNPVMWVTEIPARISSRTWNPSIRDMLTSVWTWIPKVSHRKSPDNTSHAHLNPPISDRVDSTGIKMDWRKSSVSYVYSTYHYFLYWECISNLLCDSDKFSKLMYLNNKKRQLICTLYKICHVCNSRTLLFLILCIYYLNKVGAMKLLSF